MAIYLGANQLDGGGGAGGGSSFPNSVDFTSTQLWSVPQSLQDEISTNGSARIGVLMVGGGGTSAGGEVIHELRTITSSHYFDSNNNTILVTIGAGGSTGGETAIAPQLGTEADEIITVRSPRGGSTGYNGTYLYSGLTDSFTKFYGRSGGGDVLIYQIRGSRYNGSYSSYFFNNNYSNGVPTSSSHSSTNAAGDSMTVTISSTQISYSGGGSWRYDGGLYVKVRSSNLDFSNETSPTGLIASGGGSGTNSISNRASSEGYYGGYGAAISSTVDNTGQLGRSGFVRIFYF